MISDPLDPFSEVVDRQRRWTREWYSWLKEVISSISTRIALNFNQSYDIPTSPGFAATYYIQMDDVVILTGQQAHGFSIRGNIADNQGTGQFRGFDFNVDVDDSDAGANNYGVGGLITIAGAGTAKGCIMNVNAATGFTGSIVGGTFGALGNSTTASAYGLQVGARGPASQAIHIGAQAAGEELEYGIVMDDQPALSKWFIQHNQRSGSIGEGFLQLMNPSAIPIFNVDNTGAILGARLALNAPVTTTSTSFTVLPEHTSLIFNAAGTVTLTLPAANTFNGRIIWVKNITAQLLNSASSDVRPLDSGTAGTAILTANAGRWAMLQSDNGAWVIMAGVV